MEISPLDTTLTDWRIDYPFFREEVGDIAQGALGQNIAADELFPAAAVL